MKKAELAVKKLQGELQGKCVLEAACGRAEFAINASTFAAHIECIDLDEKRLLPEFVNVKNATFRKMDVIDMTYGDETFDIIVMYDAIGHLDYVLERAINECIRVLKEQGRLVVVSSSKMDNYVIFEKLIPLLRLREMNYALTKEKAFTFVRIFK